MVVKEAFESEARLGSQGAKRVEYFTAIRLEQLQLAVKLVTGAWVEES